MRLLLLPIEIPLRLASAVARSALRLGETLLGGAVPGEGGGRPAFGQEAQEEGRPVADEPRNGPVSPEAAAVATARTEPPARGRTGRARRTPATGTDAPASRARRRTPATPPATGDTPAPRPRARRSRSGDDAPTPDIREARPSVEPEQPRPASAPAPRDDAPHDPPDGTVADRVPTGSTPASPTAPADEGDVVASFGPERDVGATIHVDEPWEGYAQMRAPDVVGRLRSADAATKAAVALYENQHRKRKSVLSAAGLEA